MNTTTMSPDHSQYSASETLRPGQLAGVVIMSQTAEYFSIFAFAIAAALAFPQVFFPNYEPVIGMLWSFAVFSLAFIARSLNDVIRPRPRGAPK